MNHDTTPDVENHPQPTAENGVLKKLFLGVWFALIVSVIALPHVYNGEHIRLVQGGLMTFAVLANLLLQRLNKRKSGRI